MFDQVLQTVKQHLGSSPEVASKIPPEHADAVHQEVANGVTDGLKENAMGGGLGGMVSSFTGGGSGGAGTGGMIEKVTSSVAPRLNGKFGLSPDAVKSITGAIPGIVQKFAK